MWNQESYNPFEPPPRPLQIPALPEQEMLHLEDSLARGTIAPEESLKIVQALPDEQKAKIGEFIGKVIRGDAYAETFYACWSSLDYNLQKEFIKHYTHKEPEHATMVAPFTDLQKATIPALLPDWSGLPPHKKRQKEQEAKKPREIEVNVFKQYLNSFEPAKRIMEGILRTPHYDPNVADAYINHFWEQEAVFILPYLPQLIAQKKFNAKILHDYLKNKNVPLFWHREFFETPAEAEYESRLIKAAAKRGEEYLMPGYNYPDRKIHSIAKEVDKIQDARAKRVADHIMPHLPDLWPKLEAEERFNILNRLTDANIPIFRHIKSSIFNDELIKKFFKKRAAEYDPCYVLNDLSDLKLLLEAGYEKQVVHILANEIKTFGPEAIITQRIVNRAEEFFSWFSEPQRNLLIRLITKEAPGAWYANVDFAIKQDLLSFKDLLHKGEYEFFEYFDILLEYAQVGGLAKVSPDELRQIVRRKIEQLPRYAIIYPKIFDKVFSPAERSAFYKTQLATGDDKEFIMSLVEHNDKPQLKPYLPQLADLLRRRRDNFADILLVLYNGPQRFLQIFERTELCALIRDSLPLLKITQDNDLTEQDIVAFMAKKPGQLSAYIKAVDKLHDPERLAFTLDGLQKLLKQEERSDKEKTFPPASFTVARRELDQGVEKIKQYCRADSSLAFGAALELKAIREFISSDMIDKQMSHSPYAMRDVYRNLSEDQLSPIKAKYLRTIAFLTPECLNQEWAAGINPLIFWGQGRNDFALPGPAERYELAMERISGNSFLPLYEARLKTIVERESSLDLEQNAPLHPEFANKVRQVALFGACPVIRDNAISILALTPEDQKILFPLFEEVSLYQLDGGLKFDLKTQSVTEVKELLLTRIADYVARIFELPDEAAANRLAREFNPNTLQALIIYYTQSASKSADMKQAVQRFVKQFAKQNFAEWRVWGGRTPLDQAEKNARLEEMKVQNLLPSNITTAQYEAWVEEDNLNFDQVLEYHISDVQHGIGVILRQAVADQHVKVEDIAADFQNTLAEYELLTEPMIDLSRRLKDLEKKQKELKKSRGRGEAAASLAEVEAELHEVRAKINEYKEQNLAAINGKEALLYLARLRNLSVKELEERSLHIEKRKIPFTQVIKILSKVYAADTPEFLHDIERLRSALTEGFEQVFGKARVAKAELFITDRADTEAAIKIGAEPVSSCQHFDSTSTYNFGLLSYVIDPGVKLIKMYDSSGRIIARSALRLLEDQRGNPELFMERIYSVNSHHQISEAMVTLSANKAKKLGVKLYSHSSEGVDTPVEEEEEEGGVVLKSRGSRSAYIYTDAAGGLKPNGVFQIKNPIRMQ